MASSRPVGQPATGVRPGSTTASRSEGEQALEAGVNEWQAARDAVDGALGLVKAEVRP